MQGKFVPVDFLAALMPVFISTGAVNEVQVAYVVAGPGGQYPWMVYNIKIIYWPTAKEFT